MLVPPEFLASSMRTLNLLSKTPVLVQPLVLLAGYRTQQSSVLTWVMTSQYRATFRSSSTPPTQSKTLGSGASIGTQPGGSYVAATLTPTAADPDAPLLTIAGVAIGADKVSFEYIASETTPTVNVAVDMLNVNFGDAVTVNG